MLYQRADVNRGRVRKVMDGDRERGELADWQ
jgi:hypothetical protein